MSASWGAGRACSGWATRRDSARDLSTATRSGVFRALSCDRSRDRLPAADAGERQRGRPDADRPIGRTGGRAGEGRSACRHVGHRRDNGVGEDLRRREHVLEPRATEPCSASISSSTPTATGSPTPRSWRPATPTASRSTSRCAISTRRGRRPASSSTARRRRRSTPSQRRSPTVSRRSRSVSTRPSHRVASRAFAGPGSRRRPPIWPRVDRGTSCPTQPTPGWRRPTRATVAAARSSRDCRCG